MKSSTNIRDLIENLIPKYTVRVHRKVSGFIIAIPEPERRKRAQDFINDLENFPDMLDRWDI